MGSRTLAVAERGAAGASNSCWPPSEATNSPNPQDKKTSTSQNMMAAYFALSVLLFNSALALPQNFEDIDLASDQPDGEVVDINQADPQSNAIHVAHNIPKDSDITVVQTNPFNSSVHLSFQNPKNTPVTLKMKDAELTHVHVSQNVPQRSPMEVEIDGAKTCQIQIAQSVPIASPLTWNLVGDPDENQIEVRQNAGDEASPLTCSPECPQEEYVYDYAYADSDSGHGGAEENEIPEVAAAKPEKPSPRTEYQDYDDEPEYTEYETDVLENEYVYDNEIDEVDPTASVHDGFVSEDSLSEEEGGGGSGGSGDGFACPGGDLQTCVDVCPGQFGAKVYGACVLSCGRRCP